MERYSFIIQTFSFVLFVVFFFVDKYIVKNNKYKQKILFLKAVQKELEWNSRWVYDIFDDEKDYSRYYDPTRADFFCENTTLKAYLLNKDGFFTKKQRLIDSLITANGAIKHYNQQVLEQHNCRFAEPSLTGFAGDLYLKNRGVLEDWMNNEQSRPEKVKYLLSEIRLRNWAINKGKKDYLKPAIIEALSEVTKEINFIESKRYFKKFFYILNS